VLPDAPVSVSRIYDDSPVPGPFVGHCPEVFLHVGDGYLTQRDPLGDKMIEYRTVVSLRLFKFKGTSTIGACSTTTKFRLDDIGEALMTSRRLY
jgi:hypothetical protein